MTILDGTVLASGVDLMVALLWSHGADLLIGYSHRQKSSWTVSRLRAMGRRQSPQRRFRVSINIARISLSASDFVGAETERVTPFFPV
ncbi:MAG: hypothetical protein P9F19_15895 [Candidatus Contendobacter sp.]|nr:hypothetical protein [Candidatus Contendobacter sp.]MDG4558854.1 hypothetical protein [Candidatus Contendobacter sp.]